MSSIPCYRIVGIFFICVWSVPEPEMLWVGGLPLFLDAAGSGKAGVPFAILPFLAQRCEIASCIVRCSMWRSLALMDRTASFTTSGFCCRMFLVWVGVEEKKMGTRPDAKMPSNMSALRGNAPWRTDTELSVLKNFFCMLAAAIGSPWNSRRGFFSWSIPTAHRTLAPRSCCSVSEEEEGMMRHGRNATAWMGTICLSVTVTVPSLLSN